MNDKEAIQKFGMPAEKEHRDTILAILEAELAKEEHELGDHDLIKCLSAQLFSIGNVKDSQLIWSAKSINFDLMCGLDVQFLCGAGLKETRSFLRQCDSEDAKEALKYIEACVDAGDFDDWTVEKWIEYYRFYYHLNPEPPAGL